jgi:hypothetical protein
MVNRSHDQAWALRPSSLAWQMFKGLKHGLASGCCGALKDRGKIDICTAGDDAVLSQSRVNKPLLRQVKSSAPCVFTHVPDDVDPLQRPPQGNGIAIKRF